MSDYSDVSDEAALGFLGLLFVVFVFGSAYLYFSETAMLYWRANDPARFTTVCHYWTPFSTIQREHPDYANAVYCSRFISFHLVGR